MCNDLFFYEVEQFYNAIQKTGSIICFDIGIKKIGIAVSDKEQSIAFPSQTIQRKNLRYDLWYIFNFIKKINAVGIISGMPFGEHETCDIINSFIKKLSKKLSLHNHELPILLYSEHHTTAIAVQIMQKTNAKKSEIRNNNDKIASFVMLQEIIDIIKSKNNKTSYS